MKTLTDPDPVRSMFSTTDSSQINHMSTQTSDVKQDILTKEMF